MHPLISLSDTRGNSESYSGAERKTTRRYADIIYSVHKNKDYRRFHRDFTSYLSDKPDLPETPDDCLDSKADVFENKPQEFDKDRLAALARLMQMRDFKPDLEDIEGAPISLEGRISLPDSIDVNVLEILQKILALKEEQANFMLAEYSQKYGYQPLFRIAIRELYTRLVSKRKTRSKTEADKIICDSEMINLVETYWRFDPRGQYLRHISHEICSQAITEFSWLNDVEQRILVRATGCFPEDAEAFCM